jgi:hypothetical protein
MTRQNLIVNPSFKSGMMGWASANNATLEVRAGVAFYGSTYLQVGKSSVGGSGLITQNNISIPSANVGLPYAASVYVRVPSIEAQSSQTVLKIIWYNSNGDFIGENASELITVPADDTWIRESVIGTAPAGVASARVSITQLTPDSTAGKKFDVDAFLFEQSSFVGGYLDNISQDEENKLVNTALTVRPEPNIFQGAELNADVTIGDLVLNTIDEAGVVWVCTDIEGWWGHSEPEIPDIQRGVEDGSYDVIGRYKARQLTLRGVFLPQSIDQIKDARDKLISSTNLVRQGVWLRTNEEPTRAAFVRLSGRPQIQTINARGRTEFSIGLKAADPIKYKWNDAALDGTEAIDIPRIDIPSSGTDVFTITTRSATLSDCTITTSQTHGYLAGQTVIVSGVSSRYNGTFKIQSATDNTFTYNFAGVVEAQTSSTGTVVNKSQVTVRNEGTSDVTAVFNVTGPIGAGSTITNTTTGEVLTIVQALRGQGPIARVIRSELFGNVATLETEDEHQLIVGDAVEVYGLGEPFDVVEAVVKTITTTTPYTFSYDIVGPDTPSSVEDGGVSLKNNDLLSINTYDRSVVYNGDIIGHRSKVDTLVDWIKLTPGNNLITFNDSVDPFKIIFKDFDDTLGIATITTSDAHFLTPGQDVTIALSEEAVLTKKALADNVITLTTEEPHGFSIGDSIDVVSTEISTITNKVLSDDVVTLTTVEESGISVGDNIVVDLNVGSAITGKSSTANVVTLQTGEPHGISVGDQLRVQLPTAASLASKSLTGGVATLGTTASHNFSIGDTLTVTLPTTTSVTSKFISGSSVVLTTATPHGFSVNDRVNIALPTTAFPVSLSYAGGSTNRVTVATSSAHGFIVGDVVSVNTGVSPTATVVTRSASAGSPGTCTITTSSTHNFSVGEQITVSGVGARYDGTHIITAVSAPSRTITYAFGTTTEGSSSATGTITNNTIASGYNGTKVVESVTTSSPHTFTYFYYGQDNNVTSSIIGNSPTITNETNASIDGVITINALPATNQFSYLKVV